MISFRNTLAFFDRHEFDIENKINFFENPSLRREQTSLESRKSSQQLQWDVRWNNGIMSKLIEALLLFLTVKNQTHGTKSTSFWFQSFSLTRKFSKEFLMIGGNFPVCSYGKNESEARGKSKIKFSAVFGLIVIRRRRIDFRLETRKNFKNILLDALMEDIKPVLTEIHEFEYLDESIIKAFNGKLGPLSFRWQDQN